MPSRFMTNSDHNFKDNQFIHRPRQTRSVKQTDKQKGRQMQMEMHPWWKWCILQDLQSAIIYDGDYPFGFGPNLKPCFFPLFYSQIRPNFTKVVKLLFSWFLPKDKIKKDIFECILETGVEPRPISRLSRGGGHLLIS